MLVHWRWLWGKKTSTFSPLGGAAHFTPNPEGILYVFLLRQTFNLLLDSRFFFLSQVSRLTWFTRLDPVVLKQPVSSVESSVRASEARESKEDGELHRKGRSPPCIQLAMSQYALLSSAFLFQTHHHHHHQSKLRLGGGLPSTGCAAWTSGRTETLTPRRLKTLRVLWRRSPI